MVCGTPMAIGDNGRMTSPALSGVPQQEASARCPCLSGSSYGECCAPYHRAVAVAPTAERLMRSRYAAFVTGDAGYLIDTWHSTTRPSSFELDPFHRYFRLDILTTTRGGMLDTKGTVEFRAFLRVDGEVDEQHEVSRFVKESGRWWYLGQD
jgi:SEC-C motif-containing protein